MVNGVAVTSGAPSNPIPLITGENVITSTGIAEDGVTTKTYTVTITRAPSSNAELASLALSSGPLTPAFDPATTSYTATAPYSPAVMSVTATISEPNAAIALNGSPIISGTAAPVTLVVGANLITVTVTAQDGVTTIDYVLAITRDAPATDAWLVGMELAPGVLTPVFISTTTSYTSEVDNLTTSVTVTPTASDANATLSVNGAPLGSGEAFTLTPLVVGPNVISTTVTAEDDVTQQTYVITVTRLGADGDWYVDPVGDNANNCHAPGVGYACQTIVGAMDKAASGDRIFIAAATYTESLVVTKSLQFIGVGGPIVSGGGTNRVVSVTAGVDVTLDGLTVANGRLTGATLATAAGAGIYNSGNLTLTNSTVTSNTTTSSPNFSNGGGIYHAAGVLQLIDSTIVSNTAINGGGLYAAGGAVTLDHTSVSSNQGNASIYDKGAGIYMTGAGTVVAITNASTLASNRLTFAGSGNIGGGIYAGGGTLEFSDSILAGNSAYGGGGGLYAAAATTVTVDSSNILSNSSSASGGGIRALGRLHISGGLVQNNACTNNCRGGGLFASTNPETVFITNTQFISNSAAGFGGGVYAESVPAEVTGARFISNTALSGGSGGAVYTDAPLTMTNVYVAGNSAAGFGGGVLGTSRIALTAVGMFTNTSYTGAGGIYGLSDATIIDSLIQNNQCTFTACEGGGLWANGAAAQVVVSGTQFFSNTAGVGGGLKIVGTATISGVQLANNAARRDGGGAYLAGPATVTGTQFLANRSTDNNYNGGGLYANTTLTVTNATVLSNTTGASGGGIFANADVTLAGVLIQNNVARNELGSPSAGGGGIFVAGMATLTDTQLISNTATTGGLNGGVGGGLSAGGATQLTHVTVLSNTSSSDGGGVRR